MRFQCVTILAVVAAVASAAPLAEYPGVIGERTAFSAKCPVDGYWWVDFFDTEGNQLPDVNSRLYASGAANLPRNHTLTMLRLTARAAASEREATPSFAKIVFRCALMQSRPTCISSAISRLFSPFAT